MKKILISFLFFLLIIQVIFFIFINIDINTDISIRRVKLEYLLPKVKNGDIVFIGDSGIMTSLNPTLIGKDWKNLAINCGSFYEDFVIIHRLLNKNITPKKVFISHHMKIILNQENCFRDITLSSNLFSIKELNMLLQRPDIRTYYIPSQQLSPFIESAILDLILSKLYLLTDQIFIIKAELINNNILESHKQVAFLKKNNGHLVSRNGNEFPMSDIGTLNESKFIFHDINKYFLEKILSELKNKNIPVVFVQPPYTLNFKKLFQISPFLKDASLYFKSLEIIYPNFKYDDEVLYSSDEYFLDFGHSSHKGAKVYTHWFKNRFVTE